MVVTLSGGPLGGTEVDGTGWAEGEVREFGGLRYRRINGQAVYEGEA